MTPTHLFFSFAACWCGNHSFLCINGRKKQVQARKQQQDHEPLTVSTDIFIFIFIYLCLLASLLAPSVIQRLFVHPPTLQNPVFPPTILIKIYQQSQILFSFGRHYSPTDSQQVCLQWSSVLFNICHTRGVLLTIFNPAGFNGSAWALYGLWSQLKVHCYYVFWYLLSPDD